MHATEDLLRALPVEELQSRSREIMSQLLELSETLMKVLLEREDLTRQYEVRLEHAKQLHHLVSPGEEPIIPTSTSQSGHSSDLLPSNTSACAICAQQRPVQHAQPQPQSCHVHLTGGVQVASMDNSAQHTEAGLPGHGTHAPGMEKEIASLRSLLNSLSSAIRMSVETDCPICCEPLEKGRASFTTECGHAFHFQCIQVCLCRYACCVSCLYSW